jgi:hypothetical protein
MARWIVDAKSGLKILISRPLAAGKQSGAAAGV